MVFNGGDSRQRRESSCNSELGRPRPHKRSAGFPTSPLRAWTGVRLGAVGQARIKNAGASSRDSVSLNRDATSIPVQKDRPRKDGPRSVQLPPAARPLPANAAEHYHGNPRRRGGVHKNTSQSDDGWPSGIHGIGEHIEITRPAASWSPGWTGTQWPVNPCGTSNYITVEEQ